MFIYLFIYLSINFILFSCIVEWCLCSIPSRYDMIFKLFTTTNSWNQTSQIWVETQRSAQSAFKKSNFGNSNQKACKRRYQNFLTLSNFTGFLYVFLKILSRIVINVSKLAFMSLIVFDKLHMLLNKILTKRGKPGFELQKYLFC